MGLSHIFKTDKHIPCTLIRTYHLFACRCACACVRESERERLSTCCACDRRAVCVCLCGRESVCVCVHACVLRVGVGILPF